jgi:hypothetical protein
MIVEIIFRELALVWILKSHELMVVCSSED